MLEAWIEWKKQCTLDLCTDASRRMLHSFARSRFERFLRSYSSEADMSAHSNPWHLFETHVTIKNTRQGKRYKDWLFARVETSSDSPLDVVQGGASLIMRDVARDFIRKECAARNVTSLSNPIANSDGSPLTLLDVLCYESDPLSEICRREYEELASRHARDVLKDMSDRERIVVVAKRIGLSLAHSSVEELAGCKKSVLNTAYHDLLVRIAATIQAHYQDEDQECILALSLMTVQQVSKQLFDWAKSENSFAQLFILVEKGSHDIADTNIASCS